MLATCAPQLRAQSLGSAETFAVLGATTVTNAGASQISGDVGVSPGTSITGFPPGVITNGALHPGDATAAQAYADLVTAYDAFAALSYPPANDLSGQDLGGLTLTPGVYHFATTATLTGTLILDAENDPSARFVIQIGTTLTTTTTASVQLVNQADVQNVFFQVGTGATMPAGSDFTGNVLAIPRSPWRVALM